MPEAPGPARRRTTRAAGRAALSRVKLRVTVRRAAVLLRRPRPPAYAGYRDSSLGEFLVNLSDHQ